MIPAPDIFIPSIFIKTSVIKISAKAEMITATEGTNVLNKIKTTIAIKINAIKIPIKSCL